MPKIFKEITIELLWLSGALLLSFLFALLLFGVSFLSAQTVLLLHGTDVHIATYLVVVSFFLFLTFLVYLIRIFLRGFNKKIRNWIFLFSGSSLLIFLTILIKSLSQLFAAGWTSYPPLSSLGPIDALQLTPNPTADVMANVLIVFHSLILLVLLYSVYRWGTTNKTINKADKKMPE